MRIALLVLALLVAGCGAGSAPSPAAHRSPAASPAASAAAAPSPAGTATSTAATCTQQPGASDRLVLARLADSPKVVVRDLEDLSHPATVCTFTGMVGSPRFVNAHTVAYTLQAGAIVEEDLAAGTARQVASFNAAGFGSGTFAWSPDGSAVTYLDVSGSGVAWHLVTASGNRVLATLPPVPGRDVDQANDDVGVSFSGDGRYVSVVTTFSTGGSGETAPFQVRRVDGTLAYSRTAGTMGVWSGPVYYFRDGGQLYRWSDDGLTPLTLLPAGAFGDWIRPKVSPDGSLVTFSWRDASGSHVAVLNLARGVAMPVGPAGRADPAFATPNVVWYSGETGCNCFGGTQSTGATYLYDLAAHSEAVSKIAALYDTWPRST